MSTERNQIERLIEVGSKMRRNAPRYPKAKATYSEWDALVAEIKSPWQIEEQFGDDVVYEVRFSIFENEEERFPNLTEMEANWLLALLKKHAPEGMPKEVE